MLNEKMTSAERATLIGLVQVTLRTDESTPLRFLSAEEVAGVLSSGAYGYKEAAAREKGSKSLAEIKKVDGQRKMTGNRNACVS
jgi:hypothetical protein